MYGTLTMLESRLGEYPPLDSSSSSISTICGHLWQPPSLFILAVFQRAQILIINSFNRQVDFTCIFIPFILQQDERANKICRLATWPHWMSAWCTFCLEVYGRGIIIFSFFVRGQLGYFICIANFKNIQTKRNRFSFKLFGFVYPWFVSSFTFTCSISFTWF